MGIHVDAKIEILSVFAAKEIYFYDLKSTEVAMFLHRGVCEITDTIREIMHCPHQKYYLVGTDQGHLSCWKLCQ